MKLREFDFNSLKIGHPTNLMVRKVGENNNEEIEGLSIGETLRLLPREWADLEIREGHWYFDTFVIEVG